MKFKLKKVKACSDDSYNGRGSLQDLSIIKTSLRYLVWSKPTLGNNRLWKENNNV